MGNICSCEFKEDNEPRVNTTFKADKVLRSKTSEDTLISSNNSSL